MAGSAGKTSVIIEIGADQLKIMQCDASRRGPVASKLHLERFDSADPGLSKKIGSAFKKGKFARVPVITCLPRHLVTMRLLELPSVDPDEIGDMVDLQISKQTPYSRDEVVSAYRILGAGRDGYMRVLLIIVQRSQLRHRYYLLEEAGLDVASMTVSTEGMLNWFALALKGGGTSAVLDVDSSSSDFSVVSEDGLLSTRSLLIGAHHLEESFDRSAEALSKELAAALAAFRNESAGVRIDRLILTGAAAQREELIAHLEAQLDLPLSSVDAATVAQKMPRSPSLGSGDNAAVSITALLGIGADPGALIFNLQPDSVLLRKNLVSRARAFTGLGIAVMTALFAGSLFGTTKLFLKRAQLERSNAQLNEIEPEVKNTERMISLLRVVNERIDANFSAASIASAIHPLIPEGVTLDSFSLDMSAGTFVFDGTAESRKDERTFVNRLNDSTLFQKAESRKGTVADQRTKRFRFSIQCEIERGE